MFMAESVHLNMPDLSTSGNFQREICSTFISMFSKLEDQTTISENKLVNKY